MRARLSILSAALVGTTALVFVSAPACTNELTGTGPQGGAPDSGLVIVGTPDAAPGTTPDAAPGGSADAMPGGPQPGDGLMFLPWPDQQGLSDPTWGTCVTDIANHLPASYGTQYWDTDLLTAAHETTHGINSELRNNHGPAGKKVNGFYVLMNRGVIIEEPSFLKSDVAAYIPASLHGDRYDTYITGQTAWDDTPTYLFDEWDAYTNQGACALSLHDEGLWTYPWQDGVAGSLEFTVYAIAEAMAARDKDPTYWASNTQYREFIAWNAKRAMQIWRTGDPLPAFHYDVSTTFYNALQTSADAKPLRQFAIDTWGAAWCKSVLGFETP